MQEKATQSITEPEMPEEEVLRRKLIFRSWHRGTKEMGFIMGRFAEVHVPQMNREALALYQALLKENDPDVYDWICERGEIPPHCRHEVMQLLIAHYAKK